MARTCFSILILWLAACVAGAQGHTRLRFIPVVGSAPLVLDNQAYLLPGGKDSFRISALRFYVSGIRFYQDTSLSWAEAGGYHLIDPAEPDGLSMALSLPRNVRYNHLAFNVGIDSATNAAGAGGGALDAANGMYWAWQSGYINMKIEGTSNLCNTRKHRFQFHLGGFRGDAYCLQHISLMPEYYSPVAVRVDVAAFLQRIDLAKEAEIMSPGSDAVRLSKNIPYMFFIKPGL